MDKKVKLGLVQMSCSENPKENLAKALSAIEDLSRRGANIIALPELFLSRYFCQVKDDRLFDMAESIPGPTTNALMEAAQRHGIVIVGSVFEKAKNGKYFNSAVVIDSDGTLVGKYHKMHIPADDLNGYMENYYFTPGDLGFLAFDTRFGKISPMICYDQWFPEGARVCAMKGAKILFYPTAIGWPLRERQDRALMDQLELQMWIDIQRSHAIANNVFVAAIDRVGVEGNLNFWGNSFVCDPYGKILAKASSDKEENLLVECDLSWIERKEMEWPLLKECRGKIVVS